MTAWPWRKRQQQADQAVEQAERLRDRAQEQQHRVESIAPQVDDLSKSLRKLHTDNHFGPMIDAILRGSE